MSQHPEPQARKFEKHMENRFVYSFVIISAILYALPFHFMESCWWLSYFFLSTLYCITIYRPVTFFHGFLWGFISFGLQLAGIFYSLFYMADSSAWYIPALSIVILSYCGIVSGAWFSLRCYIYSASKKTPVLAQQSAGALMVSWLISSLVFFEFIRLYLLWPFGIAEGYLWAYPLVPLTEMPRLLQGLPSLGLFITNAFFTCLALLVPAYAYNKKRLLRSLTRMFIILIILMATQLSNSILHQQNTSVLTTDAPSWLDAIAYIPKSFYTKDQPDLALKQASSTINSAQKNHPNVQLFLLPESSLYLCDLSKYQDQIMIHKNAQVILGALRTAQSKTFNTIYLIANGKIAGFYDKQHALVLTERLPWWAQFESFKKMYYTERPTIDASDNTRPLFQMNNSVTSKSVANKQLAVIPFICSEIFFIQEPDFTYDKKWPIISLCNDSWIFASYLQKLMLATHKLRAIEWSRYIVYVSYTDGIVCAPNGATYQVTKA